MKVLVKGVVGGIIGTLMGLSPIYYTLVILMSLDITTGLLSAYVTKSLSSKVSGPGIAKKVMVLFIVVAAGVLETTWDFGMPLAPIVAGYYCIHETLSITENAALAGVPLPKPFLDALEKFQGSRK